MKANFKIKNFMEKDFLGKVIIITIRVYLKMVNIMVLEYKEINIMFIMDNGYKGRKMDKESYNILIDLIIKAFGNKTKNMVMVFIHQKLVKNGKEYGNKEIE